MIDVGFSGHKAWPQAAGGHRGLGEEPPTIQRFYSFYSKK